MAKAKRPTYAKAKEVLLDALERAPGWEVTRWSRGRALKTPYAEHGWGRHACRMWFKTQSIYYQRNGPPFSLNAAHSIHTDPRMLAEVVISGKMTADALGEMLAERVCEEPVDNPGCLPCLAMLANPSPPPKLEALDLAGRTVALAINLHRCRPGKPIPEGAACFSVREKPRSSSKVLGYVDRVVLKDVKFVVNERSLERIQNRGTREVCCFVVGTVMRPRAPELEGACACDWTPIHFNPFRSPCFTTPKGKCAVSARYAAMVDKAVAAEGVKSR